ncbi:MAG TPA: glycosyltransferase family 4 protein [Acidimicrobiales bacterium]|nr:glycosyltransferase family 4 protein [Acidimicrobiales bacterium]
MRIAIVAPPWLPVPPGGYGGTEAVLDTLARGLVARGHDVLLCTTGDSTCPVERTWVFGSALGIGTGGSVSEIRHVIHAYDAAAGSDIVHDHTLVGPLYSAAIPGLPVVTTNHGPFGPELIDFYRAIAPRVPVIAISRHQASTAIGVEIAATIHHGIDVDEFPVGRGAGGYALFLGRMHPGKGVDAAARAARAAGVPLRIAGKMREPDEIAYFDAQVRPLLSREITYVGEVERDEKVALLGDAMCLLNPIVWPEPFGMVMIEALACGTPVVTTRFGAAPEIVDDGVVGYLCDSGPELERSLLRAGGLDRAACRRHVAERFSATRMVDEHVALYERLLAGHPGTLAGASMRGAA